MGISTQLNFLETINKKKNNDDLSAKKFKDEGVKKGMLIAAEKMIVNGISFDLIRKVTGFSKNQIEYLNKSSKL